MADYPQHLVRKRCLRDGTPVTVPPIRPQDRDMEQDFVRHLSENSRYYRFMAQLRELSPKKPKYFTEIDYDVHLALVAVVMQEDKEIEIGVARYVGRAQGESCEFAIAVDDAWQGSGIAGILMATLMDAGREHGFKTMEGVVLTDNHRMLKVREAARFFFASRPGRARCGADRSPALAFAARCGSTRHAAGSRAPARKPSQANSKVDADQMQA